MSDLNAKREKRQFSAADLKKVCLDLGADDVGFVNIDREALLINKDYPMILMAGNHMDMVANTNMRDPAWNEGRRACTMRIHPADANELGIKDGEAAVVETEAGSARVEAEVAESSHRGQVVIPHGFGLVHMEKVYGVNANRLTSAKNRDRVAATPLHRYIPCRVRKA